MPHVPASSHTTISDEGRAKGRRERQCAATAAPRAIMMRPHSFTVRSRAALAITLTEDSAIADAAIIGDSRMPNTG